MAQNSMAISTARSVLTTLFLALVMTFGSGLQARAELSIDFPGDIKISFQSGDFDLETYNGSMQGVSLFYQGELVITANSLDIESTGAPRDGKFIVRQFDMRDAILTEEDVSARSIRIRNVDIGKFKSFDIATGFDDGFDDTSSLVIEDVAFQGDSAKLTIDAVETLEFKFKTLPNGSRYTEMGGFRIDGFRITPQNFSDDAKPYMDLLADNGIRSLAMDFVSAQKTELVLGELHTQYDTALSIRDLADFKMSMALRMQLETFGKLVALGVDPDNGESDAISLLGEIELETIDISYLDKGLIDLSIALSAIDSSDSPGRTKEMIQADVAERLNRMFPRNGALLADPLDKLIASGGGIRIRVAPNSPVVLANMLGFMIIPDLALDQLNVKAAHLTAQ